MTDYQIPTSAIEAAARAIYKHDQGGPKNVGEFHGFAEAALRAAFDDLEMEKQLAEGLPKGTYRLSPAGLPVEKS